MNPDPLQGLILISLAGVATACFYAPFKRVRGWSWETYWLVFGVTSWVIVPWLVAAAVVPKLPDVLSAVPARSLALTAFFGALWGVGSLTNGLALRYLGMSLGWAIPLGLCAVLGTLLPAAFAGRFNQLLHTDSGRMTLVSVFIGLIGIATCALAGARKDRELSDDQKQSSISEFNLSRGLWLSILSGAMSACMALGIAAGKPIAAAALEHGTPSLWQNTPLFAVLLLGGFATNGLYCISLGKRNRKLHELASAPEASLSLNYVLCILAGGLWYLQSLFYGMGETKMGRYNFAGWSALMACIIICSNLWGVAFREWAGTSAATKRLLALGLAILFVSALMTSYSGYLASRESY